MIDGKTLFSNTERGRVAVGLAPELEKQTGDELPRLSMERFVAIARSEAKFYTSSPPEEWEFVLLLRYRSTGGYPYFVVQLRPRFNETYWIAVAIFADGRVVARPNSNVLGGEKSPNHSLEATPGGRPEAVPRSTSGAPQR